MGASRRRWPLQAFRTASLVVPSALAWELASTALHRTSLDEALAHALAPLWLATVLGLVARGVEARLRPSRLPEGPSWVDAVDVLTASGSSTAWTGAVVVVLSVWIGWASLSLVGLFGLCVLHVVALWTLLRAGGADPWRRASLSRRFVPGAAVEGAAVTEELTFAAPRIPAGFRLFASGRVGPRWPTTRYAVHASDTGGDLVLESHVGPAVRGTHDAEPLEVWLQDVLGLCHSPRIPAGAARLTVLPVAAGVEGAVHLLGVGGHASEPRAATRLPTEGIFRLREYQAGDDVRRIHWLRSLTARQIVVRLPDESPPERPAVRLVLDTFHAGFASFAEPLACRAPGDLLDGLVRVWVGVARALVERGVRVTAVVPVDANGELAILRSPLHRRALARARELGARVHWQAAVRPRDLLAEGPAIVVSHRAPADDVEAAARWVIVPGVVWTAPPERRWDVSSLLLPFPLASADNRRSRRREVRRLRERERADHEVFRYLCEHSQAHRSGHLLARPTESGHIRLEVLP